MALSLSQLTTRSWIVLGALVVVSLVSPGPGLPPPQSQRKSPWPEGTPDTGFDVGHGPPLSTGVPSFLDTSPDTVSLVLGCHGRHFELATVIGPGH